MRSDRLYAAGLKCKRYARRAWRRRGVESAARRPAPLSFSFSEALKAPDEVLALEGPRTAVDEPGAQGGRLAWRLRGAEQCRSAPRARLVDKYRGVDALVGAPDRRRAQGRRAQHTRRLWKRGHHR